MRNHREEYNETVDIIKKLIEKGKITMDEAKTWIKVQKLLMGPCFECKYNNCTPNGRCENCGDK